MTIKPFKTIGQYTTFENPILDIIMPECAPNTWKIVCATIRKTIGWHKENDAISISQFMRITGIASRGTCVNAIHDAVSKGYLIKIGGSTNRFAINKEYEIRTSTKIEPATSTEIEPVASTEIVLTKETVKDTTTKEKKPNGATPPEILKPFVYTLSQVTGIDSKISSNYGRLARDAKELIQAGYEAEIVAGLYQKGGAWYSDHWKGKRGERPSTKDIRESIASLSKRSARPEYNPAKYTAGEYAELIES